VVRRRPEYDETGAAARGRHWANLPHELPLFKDKHFVELDAAVFQREADLGLSAIDDLAVMVMFSALEAEFREHVSLQLLHDAETLTHPFSLKVMNDALREIEKESIERTLSGFALTKMNDGKMILRVQDIRDFRNWVAHGKKGPSPKVIEPNQAYQSLKRLLDFVRSETVALSL
jgi:hypothetical protein